MLISAVLRSRQLTGQLWFDEAGAVGIATHTLGQLPGVVRHNGGAPLYYVLLHIWIQVFGASERATHALTVLCALLTIPAAFWAGWSLSGRRAGIFAAVLFAFSAYVTKYAQETAPYALLVLLAVLTLAAFVQAFVYRRRRYLWLFTIGLTLMMYTQGSAGFFAFGALRRVRARLLARRGSPRAAARRRRSASARRSSCSCRGCRPRSTRSATPAPRGTTRRWSAPTCPPT